MNVYAHMCKESEGMFNYPFTLKKVLGPQFNAVVSLVTLFLWEKLLKK